MNLNKYNIWIPVFVLWCQFVSGQLKYYSVPLRIPVSLSGNFGELRPDHFHTGLDFRTERKTGIPVYSTAEGSVSRIVVSPGGYGHALYISHPNNTTSLYGHLLRFRDDIQKYVKEEQYRRKSFAIDLEIPAEKFRVGRQELIAYSGNTGSSGGPHLHFEIRDTPSQDALNPLLEDHFNTSDRLPPKISAVQICPIGDDSHVEFSRDKKKLPTTNSGNSYKPLPSSLIKCCGRIGIAFNANDYMDNNPSPCGIYSAQLNVSGKKTFSWTIKRISFSKNRFMNSHIDYAAFVEKRQYFQKMWRDPGNDLGIYEPGESGIVQVDSGKVYPVEIILTDVAGNRSFINFALAGFPAQLPPKPADQGIPFSRKLSNSYYAPDFEITTPENAFYEDFSFRYKKSEALPGFFSGIHTIHTRSTPVHKPLNIRIRTEGLPDSLSKKAMVAEVDQLSLKRYAGGTLSEGWMETRITKFGQYVVVADTIPPSVVPLTIRDNALTGADIRFRITDDLSGIKSYEGMIDGQWALFEYDPKNARLVYRIDTSRIGTGKTHNLELSVSDMVGNRSVFKATFWK
jgi:hypothetical protein